jgi:hypothetical protein
MAGCKHKAYPTGITARAASKAAGGKGQHREVEKCSACGKWRVKEGAV